MVSRAMAEVVANSSAIRAMFEEGKRLAALHGAENIYDFSLGNPNVDPPEIVNRSILKVVGECDPVFLHGYMVNAGYPDARKTIADGLNARYGTNYDENNVLMTAGAAGAINVAFKTIINPGDEVIVFAPFFGEYRWYVKNFGGELVICPMKDLPANDPMVFQPDIESFEGLLSNRTKAIIINSPNNPSGAIYPEATIKKISEILTNWYCTTGNIVYIVSDEPYREIAYDGEQVPFLAKYYKNTLASYSYSKSLSLPGERIGYMIVPSEIDGYGDIWPALATANRILGFVNSPSLFQRVVAECGEVLVNTAIYEENRNILYENLTKMGYECYKPKGAFYLFPKAPGGDDLAFCNAAKKWRLIIVPGRTFGAPGYFRIAYPVKKEMVMNSLDSFEKAIKDAGEKQ